MEVIIIAAVSDNGVIGQDGKIPWHLPDDIARFKALTSGHVVVMGRKTWESLPIRPLPDRYNIVLTKTLTLSDFPGLSAVPVYSVQEAIEGAQILAGITRKLAGITRKLFVCGGAEVYKEFLPFATGMEITHVHRVVGEDVPREELTFFPLNLRTNMEGWVQEKGIVFPEYSFKTYRRE